RSLRRGVEIDNVWSGGPKRTPKVTVPMKKLIFSLIPLLLLYSTSETILSTANTYPFNPGPPNAPPITHSSTTPWGDVRMIDERIFAGVATRFEARFFRAFLPPVAKQQGVKRIVFIGDSFVFGVGVEEYETLPFYLSAYLRYSRPTLTVEMVNLGSPGANTENYVYVSRLAEAYKPDLAIIGFTMSNDPDALSYNPLLLEASHGQQRADVVRHSEGGGESIWNRLTWLAGPRNLIFAHSRTFSFLYGPVRRFEARKRQDLYMQRTFGDERQWQLVRQNLTAIATRIAGTGIPVVLVMYPHMFNSKHLGLNDIASYRYGSYHRRLATFSEAIGLRVIDLLDYFKLEGVGSLDNYMVDGDGHPSGAFNGVVAK